MGGPRVALLVCIAPALLSCAACGGGNQANDNSDNLDKYLTMDGKLTNTLGVTEASFSGGTFRSISISIEPDGKWSAEKMEPSPQGRKNSQTSGKLNQVEIASIGKSLAKQGLLNLKELRLKEMPDAHQFTITFGKYQVILRVFAASAKKDEMNTGPSIRAIDDSVREMIEK